MSDDLRKQIYRNLSQRATEELLDIWRAHDCNEWSETAFGVIGEILRERGVEPPGQAKPVYQEDKRKQSTPRKGRASTRPAKWWPGAGLAQYAFGTVAVSLAVGLLASWIVYNLVLRFQRSDFAFDSALNTVYAVSCLPIQAIVLVLAVLIGAVGARSPEERWRRATYGVWITALIAILVAIIGAGVIPNMNW